MGRGYRTEPCCLFILVLPLVSSDEVRLVLRDPVLQVYVRFLKRLDTCKDASQMCTQLHRGRNLTDEEIITQNVG